MSDDPIPTATAMDRLAARDCLRCGAITNDQGTWSLRTGGSSGGVTALLGALAELGETVVDVRVTACPSCGHVEFRIPPRGD